MNPAIRIIAALSLMALATAGQAATVSVSVSQSVSGTAFSTPVNLSANGTLDWGLWQTTRDPSPIAGAEERASSASL